MPNFYEEPDCPQDYVNFGKKVFELLGKDADVTVSTITDPLNGRPSMGIEVKFTSYIRMRLSNIEDIAVDNIAKEIARTLKLMIEQKIAKINAAKV